MPRSRNRDGEVTFEEELSYNEPCPFKTSPDIWLLDGSGDLVNLQFFYDL